VKLKAFSKFQNTTEALEAATALVDSKLSKRECWGPTVRLFREACSVEKK